jgi:F-type H+-transporting ATPase subunit delta
VAEVLSAAGLQRTGRIKLADDSKATDVGARYAQALFDLASDGGRIAQVEADLKSLKVMAAESSDLRTLLNSPGFSAEAKGAGLAGIASKCKFDPLTQKFLAFVASQRRTNALLSMATSFQDLAAKARGAISAEVVTAIPMSAAQAKGVAAALRQALGKDPEVATRVDPAILGGIKVLVGSRLFDASLKSKLDSLKFALKRA